MLPSAMPPLRAVAADRTEKEPRVPFDLTPEDSRSSGIG